jgi:hypothetical protein
VAAVESRRRLSMDMYEAREQLERLFWGVIAPYASAMVPAGTESIGIPTALSRALAIVYAREIEEVRAALSRIEAALPPEGGYAAGEVSDYNRRVISLIQNERAGWDKLEAEVASMMREMDGR